MAYTPNVPQANQRIASTQAPIQANFQAIDTVNSVNHVAYNLADQGKHKFLQMPEQAAAPGTNANELGLYAAQGSISNVAELFLQRESSATPYSFTEYTGATAGWVRLPSGVLIKWGRDAKNMNTAETFAFPVTGSIPPFTVTPWAIVIQSIGTQRMSFKWDTANAANNNVQYVVSGVAIGGTSSPWDFLFVAIGI